MNDRTVVRLAYAVGEQSQSMWPVSEVTIWNDDTANIRLIAFFFDHETADEFCRRWIREGSLPTDEAGFRS
jgi:hypothetical protein